jgi:hydrogenase expression/formation protein HypD
MKESTQKIISEIKKESENLKSEITLMEVCGGHTNTIMRYGLRDILPQKIRLISGPGCPVCVTSQHDIDCMIELAHKGIPIATYGDMLRVPGTKYNLEDARSKGGIIKTIYSTSEVLKYKTKYPNIVFFGIGFETTAPMTAFLLQNQIAVYSVHKRIIPAMKVLLKGELKIDGFIDPGHVSVIIGSEIYKQLNVPQAIAGFEPEEILNSIYALIKLINNKANNVINTYPQAVKKEGNLKAQNLLEKYFNISTSDWRGLGLIENSGYEVKNPKLNAKIIYKHLLKDIKTKLNTGCRCGEILKGLINSEQCKLFGKVCTPENPIGACMVSEEGACNITYRYKQE